MPLVVGAAVAAPPLPLPPAPPAAGRPAPALDLPTLTWIDPFGVEWPLTDLDIGWFTPDPGPKGLFGAVPMSMVTVPRARGGVDVLHHQPEPRTVTWPLYVEGGSYRQFRERLHQLLDAFTSTSWYGPGRIRVAQMDGSARVTAAYCQEAPDPETMSAGLRACTAVMTLLCPDGYWRDLEPTPIVRQDPAGGLGRSFLKRFPRPSSGQTLGAKTVTNPGKIRAWPVWRITGPLDTVTVLNERSGESWTLDVLSYRGTGLLADETVVIDTEIGAVTGPTGDTWAGAIDWTVSRLWPLERGDSDIAITATGPAGRPRIEAEFYATHEAA